MEKKTIELKFHNDGKVTVEAFGYTEKLSPDFEKGQESDIYKLKDRQACISDVFELIQAIGKIEDITPKKPDQTDDEIKLRLKA